MRVILSILVGLILCRPVFAQQMDKVLVLQDEVFFLQNELTQLKQALAEKDAAFKSSVIEKDVLAAKVSSLQHSILERDADLPRLMEQSGSASRAELGELKKELRSAALLIAQKVQRLAALEKEKDTWQLQKDMLEGEKIALRQSLKTVAEEADGFKRTAEVLKSDMGKQLADAKAASELTASDLKSRIFLERSRAQEEVTLALKPLGEKIAMLQDHLKAKDTMCVQQVSDAKAVAGEQASKLEQQIAILRESAGQEIKKAQDAAAMSVQKIQSDLTACRSEKK